MRRETRVSVGAVHRRTPEVTHRAQMCFPVCDVLGVDGAEQRVTHGGVVEVPDQRVDTLIALGSLGRDRAIYCRQ